MSNIYAGKVIKAPIDVTFTSLNTDPTTLLVTTSANAASYNFNATVTTQQALNLGGGGVARTVYNSTDAEDPQITLTFPSPLPNMVAMRFDRALETSASEVLEVSNSNLLVTGSGSYPAVATGQYGFEIAADEPNAVAAVHNDAGSEDQLTLSTFSTFDPVLETTSFAVGVNGALKFSNDLIGKTVSYSIPATYTNVLKLGDGAWSRFKMVVTMLNNDRSITQMVVPEAEIRRDQGDITFGEELQLTFSPTSGGRCQPIDMYWLPNLDACLEPEVA